MEEIWKDIEEYIGLYQISNFGRVKRLPHITMKKGLYPFLSKEIIMKLETTLYGYVSVGLTKDKKQKHHFVHRLVAKAFVENEGNKPFVNHKDGIRNNNIISNLEWCTSSENERHAIDILSKKSTWTGKFGNKSARHTKVIQLDKDGGFIRLRDCISDVQRELGLSVSNISRCCKGLRNYCGGYSWSYDDKLMLQILTIADKMLEEKEKE